MKIIEENGVEYMEMYCPSVAEVFGLVPAGSSKAMRFPVVGTVKRESGEEVPMLDIKMMTDEEWRRYTEGRAEA